MSKNIDSSLVLYIEDYDNNSNCSKYKKYYF